LSAINSSYYIVKYGYINIEEGDKMEDRKIRFGLNYVPSKKWAYSWMDWDRTSIFNDLKAISSIGMDHIRIHLLWPYFQPNNNYVSEVCLDRLSELLDLADSCNLDVAVTVLDGWLCGYPFYTTWKKERNIFTDPLMISAEKLLFTKIAQKIGEHKRFLGFDIGNELDVLNFCGCPITLEEGDAWHSEMISHCEEIAPNKFHVSGLDHIPWFNNIGFSRPAISNTGSATALHAWIAFTDAMKYYKPMESGSVNLAEFFIEMANAYSNDINRPVWMQEFGASDLWMSDEEKLEFAEKTILNAAGCKNVWGFTWWCSHDIDRSFEGFDPLEYEMGIFDVNNNIKPIGTKLAQIIRNFRNNAPKIENKYAALVLPEDVFITEPDKQNTVSNPLWAFARKFFKLIDEGIKPLIVLECKIDDKEYLASRGIKELIIFNMCGGL